MIIQLEPDQVTALMTALPDSARGPDSGFIYADGELFVPDHLAEAVAAIDLTKKVVVQPETITRSQLFGKLRAWKKTDALDGLSSLAFIELSDPMIRVDSSGLKELADAIGKKPGDFAI